MEWKEIKGYEGYYEVSTKGKIRSVNRIIKKGDVFISRKSQEMKTFLTRGYERVSLNKEGIRRKFLVHRLVAETFIPNPDNKKEVNHKDGDKSNNSIDNLEWVTKLENMRHAENNKLIKRNKGSQHYNSKLTEDLVREMRIKFKNGSTPYQMAKEYGVNDKTIRQACLEITWRHVK